MSYVKISNFQGCRLALIRYDPVIPQVAGCKSEAVASRLGGVCYSFGRFFLL